MKYKQLLNLLTIVALLTLAACAEKEAVKSAEEKKRKYGIESRKKKFYREKTRCTKERRGTNWNCNNSRRIKATY
ncbi:hypothetical protein [Bacillus pseudomycoides]|uniref:hypothetical protein n=1 Tax=Bacillus pseudomycoides TaxID=64104 RepID=UPI001FB4002E|nr:hypothetical protein [Bacillus pseudomycoides]